MNVFDRDEYLDNYGLQVDPLFDKIDELLNEIEKQNAVIEAAKEYISPLDHIENRDAELRLMSALKALKEKE